MNGLMIFENEEVEIFEFEGQILFNPTHVGKCLGLSEYARKQQVKRMNEKQVLKLRNIDFSTVPNCTYRKLNNRGENFLTESGVYNMIFASRCEMAKKFQDWVTDEVLPSIRKTGGYICTTSKMSDEDIMAKAILLANTTIQERDKRNKELEPQGYPKV